MSFNKQRLALFRSLLNEGSTANDGVWGRAAVSRAALLVQYGLILALSSVAAGIILPQGDWDALWFSATVGGCALASWLPGETMTWYMRKEHGSSTDTGQFTRWALGAMALGLPSGHLALLLVEQFHPIDGAPFKLTWAPELFLLAYLALYYGRLVQSRQWQFRLDAEQLKREAAEQGQALALAQLKMLQAQIEPHFLFNTLASVQQLVRKDPVQADYMLGQFIRYLREAIPQIQGMGSTLGREFGLVGAYLNIHKVRMGDRLSTHIILPEELAAVPFPSLIIQTLVENAVKHGVEPKSGSATIRVSANQIKAQGTSHIQVTVQDDGIGFGAAETVGTGVGLRNVRERLAGLYGNRASLEIASAAPHGVQATVTIPGSAS